MYFSYFYAVLKQFFTPYIYILLFLTNFQLLFSQEFQLEVLTKDSITNLVVKQLNFKRNYQDIQQLFLEVDSLQLKFELLGYLNNRLDSLVERDSLYTAHFNLGKSTKAIRIFYDSGIIAEKTIGSFAKKVTDQYVETNIANLPTLMHQFVSHFENQGKSFTRIFLSNIAINENILTAILNIETSNRRNVDRIIIKGYENFPKTYLKHFFDLDSKTIFSTQKIKAISERTKALNFVSELKPPEVLFTKDSTYLYLYLKKEKANRFDGLVGFTSDETRNSLNFNGYLDVQLANILNSGESIRLNWRNNGDERQVFNFGFELPYIFQSPFTPELALDIYKQDSTFINTNLDFKVSYLLNYRNRIGLVLNTNSSDNLLDNPIEGVENFSAIHYGVDYDFKVLNNSSLFPVKLYLNASATLGNRKYEGITGSQSQLQFKGHYLWSFNRNNHLFLQNETALLNSDDYLTNELYRIGGVNSIRGFNEESIFASLYTIMNLEYRFSPNDNSYLYSISDIAYTRNALNQTSEQILSLGAGYAFRLNFGLLNLSYAIGKFDDQDFDFNNSRFHLKIVSFF